MAPHPELVSIVIPCYNPTQYLLEAIASAKAQTRKAIETIVVDDGTDTVEGKEVLRSVSQKVDHYVEQPNGGLAAARNAGFRAASGSYVLPLDSDDVLQPTFVDECLAAIRAHSDAAFVYTDYRVFGTKNYVERLEDYNLYHLLDRNSLVYASLIRKQDWALAGGYDESMKFGYEDWEFWLRLGARGRFGHHLGKVLFEYRKHGPSLFDIARARHDELVGKIRSSHPELYAREARARIKARWEPAVCVVGTQPATGQTIEDWQAIDSTDPAQALAASKAGAFLLTGNQSLDPHSAELAGLAVWGGNRSIRLADGSVALSRRELAKSKDTAKLKPKRSRSRGTASPVAPRYWPARFDLIHRHLVNAGLLSTDAWIEHPLRSASRLIPLRLKQRVNRLAGRPLFDLSFYLRFQPRSLMVSDTLIEPLRYMPKPRAARQRVALVTRHLGPGGAERVLLEIAGSLNRSEFELLLIATHSDEARDARWLGEWQRHAEHIYDLAPLVSPDRLAGAVYSIATNWQVDFFMIQNSLEAYAAIPQLRKDSPGTKVMDLVHAVDQEWDVISATAAIAGNIDTRIVGTEAARERLRRQGAKEASIRLIRHGIDLQHFSPAPPRKGPARILVAGRLDPVKRPLLTADIALALMKRRGQPDFQFLVAGDGPEEQPLRRRLRQLAIEHLFVFLGYVPDMASTLAESDVVIIPSKNEGIPLVLLEALATGRPVIASDVGAIGEVLGPGAGSLIGAGADEVERFADAIATLLDQPALLEKLGREGRRKMEAEYDILESRRAYRQLFASARAGASGVARPD
jgi:glycosyltransferase involved in cell wall biosynthesis